MAQYDLTTSMSRFLDRHLILPILETLEMKQIYPLDELLPTKVELLAKTNMVDFHMDVYKKLHKLEDASADVLAGNADLQAMEQRKIQVVASLEKISADAADILGITVENSQLAANLRAEKKFTVEYLMENYELTEQQIDALYYYAKANYEIGNYAVAADCLFQYIPLSCASPSRQKEFYSALWGKFASEILMQNWDVALEDLNRLRELLLTKTYGTPEEQLQQRTWLIHWSLFVFFNHPAGRNGIVDMFFQDKYLNTIQTNCPHVLRYLVAAVIIYKKRRNMIKDMVRVLQQDPVAHQDPVIQFLECLFVHFDFDKAQQKLRDCEELLNTDYFLAELREDFIENARILMFETYCRIHQCIDIKMLAEKLNMNLDEAERWIVNLIRNARLDAKIDSAQGRVIMGTQYPSLYQQVIDKTKALSYRTFVMANTIARQEV